MTTYTPSTGDFTDLANGSSTGASAALQEMVLNTAIVVDNTTKSYNLLFAHGATGGAFVLAGATVEYTFNATLGAGGRPSSVSGSSE